MTPLLQNLLVIVLIAGFACMEYVSRRYRDTVVNNLGSLIDP